MFWNTVSQGCDRLFTASALVFAACEDAAEPALLHRICSAAVVMVTQSGSLLLRASGAGRWLLLTLLLTTARILGGIADILTLPVHLVLQKPWRRR